MTIVILAGGCGTRLGKLTHDILKPLVTIGNIPIIELLIDYYKAFGSNHIIICTGYLAPKIFEYYSKKMSNIRRVIKVNANC